MGSEATYSGGWGDPLFSPPLDIDAFLAQIPHGCDLLPLDESASACHIPPDPESAGHISPDLQSAGDTSHSSVVAGLHQAVLYDPVGLAGATAATGAEGQHEQNAHAWFDSTGTSPGLTQPATYPVAFAGTGMEGAIPSSSSAPPPLDFDMQGVNAALTPAAEYILLVANNPPREPAPLDQEVNAGAGLVPEPEPYSTGDSSYSCTTADLGIKRSPVLEVNAEAAFPQSGSGGGALTKAPVRTSCKRKKLICGSSNQRLTSEFNSKELLDVLPQSDPSSDDIKPPTGSADGEIIDFLGRVETSMPHGKEVNLSVGEQDQICPRAVRSYVTTVEMMPDQKTHLGYWKNKQVEADVCVDESGKIWTARFGFKRTFQFHKCDGTKTNWFMHEYICTGWWGCDMFMKRLRFRKVYKVAEVPGDSTSPEEKIKRKTAAEKKHRMRDPENLVIEGESNAWLHFFRIYDRHPELEGSKLVYAVCFDCEGVLKADNGTRSMLNHCERACRKLQPKSPS